MPAAAEEEASRPREVGHIDGPLTMLVILLVLIGLVVLFSASYATSYNTTSKNGNVGSWTLYIEKQAKFAAVGLVVMFGVTLLPDYRKLHYVAWPLLLFSFALMATILIPSLKEHIWKDVNGAIRWIEFPHLPRFQPSEIAKLAVILSFSSAATVLGEKRMKTFEWGLLPFMIVLGGFAFLMYEEKHLSGTIFIALIGIVIIYVGGANFWMLLGGGIGGAALVGYYIKSNIYAQERIRVWLHPFDYFIKSAANNYNDKGWQGGNSLIAIGSGGFWGLGLGQGRQKHLYLPEPANDFIFSVACEELGFVGALLIMLVFAALICRGYYIARNAGDKFGTLVATGITTQIALQVAVNLFVVTGLCPITGASLPFFSYGGTSLLMELGEMGILLLISKKIPLRE